MVWEAYKMNDEKSKVKKGEYDMPTVIQKAIASQYESIDAVNAYIIREIEDIKRIGKLDDNDPEKIQKKQEVHDLMVSIGIITEENELSENYKQ
jgi:hypothetical protein